MAISQVRCCDECVRHCVATYRDLATFRDQVLGSVSYFAGRHDIRFGYQFMTAVQQSSTWSTSGMRAVYRNGMPDSGQHL